MSILSTVLVACNQQTYTASNVNGEWYLKAINGNDINTEGLNETPYISFNAAEKSFTGNTGCNIFFGNSITNENDANAIRFDGVGSTKVMCMNMEVEDENIDFNNLQREIKKLENENKDELANSFSEFLEEVAPQYKENVVSASDFIEKKLKIEKCNRKREIL